MPDPASKMDCVFCQIATRQAPASVIFEDDRVIAFAPIDSVSSGHTLIAPKAHYESLSDITSDVLKAVMEAARSIALNLLTKSGATGINLLHASGADAQQSVLHFHVHLVPRYPRDGLELWLKNKL